MDGQSRTVRSTDKGKTHMESVLSHHSNRSSLELKIPATILGPGSETLQPLVT